MKQMKKRILALLLCLLMLSSQALADFEPEIDINDGETMYSFFESLMRFTQNQYRFDVTQEEMLSSAIEALIKEHPELFDEIMKGVYGALDENSRYLTSAEFTSETDSLAASFYGVGITFSDSNGVFVIGSTIEGTPAQKAGIQAGDLLVSVDGQDLTGMYLDYVIELIRGPLNSEVTLGIVRDGQNLQFTMKRESIAVNPVSYTKLEQNNAGYVKLSTFSDQASDHMTDALNDLASQGVDKVILDLRDNLGGYVNEAVSIASNFLPDGAVVVTESYKNEANNQTFTTEHTDHKFKVVVLVNEYTASASEIVSGAIQAHDAGVLIGTTTYGKGTVQIPLRLKNGSGIALTVAQYLTPDGAWIHGVGLTPDYVVKNRITSVDIREFEPLTASRVLRPGDNGSDVVAIKQRLQVLGYQLDSLNNLYDASTERAVAAFQRDTGLFSYGIMDFTTQIKLAEEVYKAKVEYDDQLDKALELIYNME